MEVIEMFGDHELIVQKKIEDIVWDFLHEKEELGIKLSIREVKEASEKFNLEENMIKGILDYYAFDYYE